MHAVILTVHVIVVLALIGVVLLQRSEGGGLGMGGSPGGGFMTSRGAANLLTRTTSVLTAIFFTTSIVLALTADRGVTQEDIIEDLTGEEQRDPNAPITTDDFLDSLGADRPSAPEAADPATPNVTTSPATGLPTLESVPSGATPAAETPAAAPAPTGPAQGEVPPTDESAPQ